MTERAAPARVPRALAILLAGYAGGAVAALEYKVGATPAKRLLDVDVCTEGAVDVVLRIDGSAGTALHSLSRSDGGQVERDLARLRAPGLPAEGCLRYRIDLDRTRPAAARTSLTGAESIWLLAPAQWLLRPVPPQPISVKLDLPAGWHASLPWPAQDGDPDRYRLPTRGGDSALSAFGEMTAETISLPGGRIELAVLAHPASERSQRLLRWQREAAQLVPLLFGHAPLPSTQVLVAPVDGREPVPWAQSDRSGGIALHFYAGGSVPLSRLRADWTAAHEYTHLFHPYLGPEGSWLAEGLASYYQNVLRVRAGLISPAQGWQRLHAGFERGRSAGEGPALADSARRMRADRSFMRVYWSGAAFWLEADIALRRGSGGVLSLDEALRRFAACCLPQTRAWTGSDFVARLERVLGSEVLVPLYRHYHRRTDFPDLGDAYAALALDPDSGRVLVGGSGAAALRDAIMRPPDGRPVVGRR